MFWKCAWNEGEEEYAKAGGEELERITEGEEEGVEDINRRTGEEEGVANIQR